MSTNPNENIQLLPFHMHMDNTQYIWSAASSFSFSHPILNSELFWNVECWNTKTHTNWGELILWIKNCSFSRCTLQANEIFCENSNCSCHRNCIFLFQPFAIEFWNKEMGSQNSIVIKYAVSSAFASDSLLFQCANSHTTTAPEPVYIMQIFMYIFGSSDGVLSHQQFTLLSTSSMNRYYKNASYK